MTQSRKFVPTVMAAAVGAVIGSLAVNQLLRPNRGLSIDGTIMRAASELNKNLPMMLDADTRWDSTVAGPGKAIIYRYTAVKISKDAEFDPAEFHQAMRPTIVNNYRTNDSLKWYRNNGVSMHYQYSDRDGVFLTEIVVRPNDTK